MINRPTVMPKTTMWVVIWACYLLIVTFVERKLTTVDEIAVYEQNRHTLKKLLNLILEGNPEQQSFWDKLAVLWAEWNKPVP